MAAHAFALLDSYIYGFILQELNLPFSNSEELDDLAESIFSEATAAEYPHLTELALGHVRKPGYAFAHEFEWRLDVVLEGLERKRAKKRS